MKNFLTKLLNELKNPSKAVIIITFIVTVITSVLAIILVINGFDNGVVSILAYVLFSVAALSLAYSVYIIVIKAKFIKNGVINLLKSNSFTNNLISNYSFRTVIFSIISFVFSVIFSVFNGYMGIKNLSIWYGALSAYYIALAFLRGGILFYHKNKNNGKIVSEKQSELNKAKVFLNSGIILLILNVSLSSAIAQMIFSSAHFTYAGLTIFAYAAYAFYKITTSIINLIKANKQPDLTIRAIRNVNLADATVSILALQTALLTTFNDGSVNVSLMNTFTGIAVSGFSIGLAIYMIVTATKTINKLRKEI